METYLESLSFWSGLDREEQCKIKECSLVKRYDSGSLIYAKDQECLGLILVISGSVRTFMLSETGREIELYTVTAGDADVLSASCVLQQIHFETQMVAETDCELLIVPAAYLSGIKEENIYVKCYLYEKLGERFSNVMSQMQSMLFTRVDSRVAGVLLKLGRNGSNPVIHITHEKLAGEINSSREVVSRALKEMERRGEISLGRGNITLRKAQALRQYQQ